MTTLETFNEAYAGLVNARVRYRNTKQALTGNLPKHKIDKYKQVVSDSDVAVRNATSRVEVLFKKLNTREQIEVSHQGVRF